MLLNLLTNLNKLYPLCQPIRYVLISAYPLKSIESIHPTCQHRPDLPDAYSVGLSKWGCSRVKCVFNENLKKLSHSSGICPPKGFAK
jgi:hypothetical protein